MVYLSLLWLPIRWAFKPSFDLNSFQQIGQIILGVTNRWVFSWAWSLSFLLKDFEHVVHWNDTSAFWKWIVSRCLSNVNRCLKFLLHTKHWWVFKSSLTPGRIAFRGSWLCSTLLCFNRLSQFGSCTQKTCLTDLQNKKIN